MSRRQAGRLQAQAVTLALAASVACQGCFAAWDALSEKEQEGVLIAAAVVVVGAAAAADVIPEEVKLNPAGQPVGSPPGVTYQRISPRTLKPIQWTGEEAGDLVDGAAQ